MGAYVVDPSYFNIADKTRPLTPLEAMMRCDFNELPDESALELEDRIGPLADLLEAALNKLEPIEREIVRRNLLERVSLRDLAREIERPEGGHYGKTWIAEIRDKALAKLKDHLIDAGLEACGFGDSPELTEEQNVA